MEAAQPQRQRDSLDSGCRLRSVSTQMAMSRSLGIELARGGQGQAASLVCFLVCDKGPMPPTLQRAVKLDRGLEAGGAADTSAIALSS